MADDRDGQLRFDGRVAIVTGAGGQDPSLGAAFARTLAARGAKVVVNDLGVGPDGTGALVARAQQVADDIVRAGGEAIADTHSVADAGSAKAVVQTAIDAWGGVDILVNNAGIVLFTLFDEMSDGDVRRMVDTHLYGNIWMARAVWPHMKAAGYGRIVNISSGSVFGHPYLSVYGAAKGGIYGLTNALAYEGSRLGIQVNALAPIAGTHQDYLMGREGEQQTIDRLGSVDQVAAPVVYMCHERCDLTGRFLFASGGKVSEYRMYESQGLTDPAVTLDSVHRDVERITGQAGAAPIVTHGPDLLDRMPRRAYVPRD